MSVTCGFYNSLNHDRKYNATQMSSLFDGIINDGVFMSIGTHLSVTAGSGMSVTVGEGKAWFNHTWTLNDAELPLTIEASELVLDRIDAVVLEVNATDSVRDNFIKVVKGTPSSEPVRPEMENTETVHQYALAYIYVKANATSITTSDITNMIGTGDTPFITGILETINIDSLIAQWKSQWNDQVDSNQREYDAWLLAQQTSFLTWREGETSAFDTWKTTEQAEFEEWFMNLQNQLDENQATNLQNQINDINEDIEELADALPYAGGSRVIVTIDDKKGTVTVAGLTATLRIGSSVYTATVGNDNKALFAGISEIGVAEIECNDSTQGLNTGCTLEIHCYSLYEVTTVKIDMYEQWLLTAGYTTSKYPELESILSDEEAMFRMMNLHASVDYWIKWYSADNTILPKFTASATAMNAIGDNDYAADTLMAIPEVKEALLASEYWEYVFKALVPTMTSNTASNGNVFYDSINATTYEGYKAFDNDETTWWSGKSTTTGFLGYKFTSPTEVKLVKHHCGSASKTFIFQYSDDATTWYDASDSFTSSGSTADIYELNNNLGYHIYWRIYWPSTGGTSYELQFYGRQLNVSVPTMTSNTTPEGEVSASSFYATGFDPWMAFDGAPKDAYAWYPDTTDASPWLCYKFSKPVCVKKAKVLALESIQCQIKYSDNGTDFISIGEKFTLPLNENNASADNYAEVDLNNTESHSYWAIFIDGLAHINYLQFYGVSYEETVEPATGVNFDYSEWCESAGLNAGKYASLDDLLDDEKGIRTLMTKTASVDYLAQALTDDSASAAKILEDIYVAKWVNYREYAYSSLSAVPGLKSIMDKTGKYGMYITVQKSDAKPTEDDEVDKALVPKLSSNTGSDGGQAISSTPYSGKAAYNVFDGSTTEFQSAAATSASGYDYLGYKFTQPTSVREVSIDYPTVNQNYSCKIQYSDDGSSWTDASELYSRTTADSSSMIRLNVDDCGYHMYWRFYSTRTFVSSTNYYLLVKEIQFYGRQLDALVPPMTSNTAPSGECFSSGKYEATAYYHEYNAFNGTNVGTYDCWHGPNGVLTGYLGYKFVSPVRVRAFSITNRNHGSDTSVKTIQLQGSNDGSDWVNVGTQHINPPGSSITTIFTVSNDVYYSSYRVNILDANGTDGISIGELQFYGKVKPQLKGLIPVMTSNTCEVGEASASSVNSSSFPAYYAFDNDTSTCWESTEANKTNAWLQYKFYKPTCVKGFDMTPRAGRVKNYRIEASNDGIEWTTLYTGVSESEGKTTEDITNDSYYMYYRIFVLDNQGGTYNVDIAIKELQFYGYQLIPMVPPLTSNTGSDGGQASASSSHSSCPPLYAFNSGDDAEDAGNWWAAEPNASPAASTYIQYKFSSPTVVSQCRILSCSNNMSCVGKIQVSNNGTTWIDASDEINFEQDSNYTQTSGSRKVTNRMINLTTNGNAYIYYRLRFVSATSTHMHDGQYVYYGLSTLQFYGVEKWQPKGLVPVMTSNTAPYGEASASSEFNNHYAWHAFDNDTNTIWHSEGKRTSKSSYIQYKFINPTSVKTIAITNYMDSNSGNTIYVKVEGSNDGSTWSDLTGELTLTRTSDHEVTEVALTNNSYYLFYRVWENDLRTYESKYYSVIRSLQFYGRQLEALVPPMTSNTAPVGEVIYSSEYSSTDNPGWKAFDGKQETGWLPKTGTKEDYVGYKFQSPVRANMMYLCYGSASYAFDQTQPFVKVQASNDNSEWIDLSSQIGLDVSKYDAGGHLYVDFDNDQEYLYYRASFNPTICVTNSSTDFIAIHTLQFYGAPDYETRTYIYDHGVEVMELVGYKNTTSYVAEKQTDRLYLKKTGSGSAAFTTVNKINMTNYSLMRAWLDTDILDLINCYIMNSDISPWVYTHSMSAGVGFKIINTYDGAILDETNVNLEAYAQILVESGGSYNETLTVNQWWLE